MKTVGPVIFALLLAFWILPWHVWGQGVLHFNKISWILSTTPGITAQKIYRGTVSGGPYALIQTINDGTSTSYTDVAVTLGATNCYVLTASVGTQESVFSTELCLVDKGTNVNPQTGLAATQQ